MNTVLQKSESRGRADHGWLNSRHTFSFGGYYEPSRMHFGMIRVLNDDIVAPGRGFDMHPHRDMEIISIPLSGDLEHKDNMGNSTVIRAGDIQVMSAGTGILHSEYNKNRDRDVRFLQIWVIPNKRSVEPRYDQISLDPEASRNQFQQVLSPNADDEGVWIHQDAWFHLAQLDAGVHASYSLKKPGNGIYLFVLEGSAKVGNMELGRRDGLGVSETGELHVEAIQPARVLLMEVPMN